MITKTPKLLVAMVTGFSLLTGFNSANAKTADAIINSGKSPEQIGQDIAIEGDTRDLGFIQQTVNVTMTLKNKYGQETKRNTRNKTLEVQDTSIGDKTLVIFDTPRDVKGTVFLTHSKILEADNQWLYLPALKRVKRISSKNKSGPFMGSEFAYEDISSREVEKFKYKYLRSEACPTGTVSGQCFVVESYPQYENSGYTKQVVWVDHAEFRPIKIDFFDRKNSALKTLIYSDYKQFKGKFWRAKKMHMTNLQNGKSTTLEWNNYNFDAGLSESDFTNSRIKNVR